MQPTEATPQVHGGTTPTPQTEGVPSATPTIDQPTVPATGSRASIRNLRRDLTPEESLQSGVHKLLIEDLERAEAECERLNEYIDKYHKADKQVCILDEKLRTNRAMEIANGVGLAGGSAMAGLSPFFWQLGDSYGRTCLYVGILFIVGATAAKIWMKR